MKTVNIIVTGKVQGVHYRKATKDKARELGIGGWVRNEDDGSVRITASGETQQLDKLAEWCKDGSDRAEVTAVDVTELPYHQFTSFISER